MTTPNGHIAEMLTERDHQVVTWADLLDANRCVAASSTCFTLLHFDKSAQKQTQKRTKDPHPPPKTPGVFSEPGGVFSEPGGVFSEPGGVFSEPVVFSEPEWIVNSPDPLITNVRRPKILYLP